MIRRSYPILALAGLLAAPVVAQQPQVRRVGGNAQLVAYIPGSGQTMSGTPKSYKDSVLAVWARRVPAFPAEVQSHIAPGAHATLVLRLLRNGDLHRVRLEGSLGDHTADSLLLAGAREADDGLLFPPLPPAVAGAGTELRIEVGSPIPANNRLPGRLQNVVVPPPSPACIDSLATPTAVRMVRLSVGIDSITGGGPGRTWGGVVLKALADAWQPVIGARPRVTPSLYREQVSAPEGSVMVSESVRLSFDGTGHLLAASSSNTTIYPSLDSAVIAAAWRVDSAHLLPPPPSTSGDTATLDLGISESTGSTDRLTLGTASVASWEVEVLPAIVSPGVPRYPPELKRQHVGGRVEIEFVVGTDGHPMLGSIAIISTPHPDLAAAAITAIAETRFSPGRIRGCPVPILVRQGVNFNP